MSAATEYANLEGQRSSYITRAERQAKVTIPSLFPKAGETKTEELYTPFQSIGARGVNNLTAKILLSQFPPNSSFFKLSVDDITLEQMTGKDDIRAEVDKSLGKIEKKILFKLETSQFRPTANETIKQLIVAGNACLYFPGLKQSRMFKLNQYVVKRSPNGKLLKGIIKEPTSRLALPKAVRDWIDTKDPAPAALPSADKKLPSTKVEKDDLDLYTVVQLGDDGKYHVHQELKDSVVPGSEGSYVEDKCPYLFLRFNKLDGEDYGRGYVEDYFGDLYTLESLMQAVVSGAIIMSKFIFLVDPAGTTRAEDLAKAENGDFVEGNIEDIKALQTEKQADLTIIFKVVQSIEERLSYAFLLNTAVQRNGERVTAEEIRYMARELEDGLGGVYSVLAQTMQLPLAAILLHTLSEAKEIPKLPDSVEPMIVTGIEALGRGTELQKIDQLLAGAKEIFGDEAIRQYVSVSDYFKRRGTALGIDTGGLIRTEDEVNENNEVDQVNSMGPDAMKAGAALATKAMEQAA
jgi:hypothetical protein